MTATRKISALVFALGVAAAPAIAHADTLDATGSVLRFGYDGQLVTDPANLDTPVAPGSTIGVLGSGQLGRMLALEARRMGYRVHTFSPDTGTPTGQVADLEVTASYTDLDALDRFARGVQVVTLEFENVPAGGAVLKISWENLQFSLPFTIKS